VVTCRDRAKTAQAFAMSDFSSTISQLMSKWNDPNADAATRVQQKLDAVKGVMIDNIG
jgi:singapore isolate B (sub-type 7) whole genome shotgun sequence assembly, scaffold_4